MIRGIFKAHSKTTARVSFLHEPHLVVQRLTQQVVFLSSSFPILQSPRVTEKSSFFGRKRDTWNSHCVAHASPNSTLESSHGRRSILRRRRRTKQGIPRKRMPIMTSAGMPDGFSLRRETRTKIIEGSTKKKVAVIGAGAAGLISAKELRDLGHDVVVYEQTNSIGGVWAYTDEVEDDLLGSSGSRKKVHGSMYKHLRTNLPREVMGVSDFPFDDQFPGSKDYRQYCSHEEVYRYLNAYARQFDILKHVKCSSTVEYLQHAEGGWTLRVVDDTSMQKDVETHHADAVVVCNGHYSEPRVPEYEGQESFKGVHMHSHNYRTPDWFVGKRVVVVGAAFSGSDISQELLEHGARAVYLSGRNWEDLALGKQLEDSREVIRVADIARLENFSVTFVDGTVVEDVDVVMYATGYTYHFPFAQDVEGMPQVDDNRLCALYKHVFPPKRAPWLSFVGIPWKVVPFPQFQLQARWIGSCLNGSCELPSASAMQEEIENWYQELDTQGIQKRYTHRMDPDSQGEYNTWLASQTDSDVVGWPEWRRILYLVSGMNRRQNGIRFREYSLCDLGAKEALDEFQRDAQEVRKAWMVHSDL